MVVATLKYIIIAAYAIFGGIFAIKLWEKYKQRWARLIVLLVYGILAVLCSLIPTSSQSNYYNNKIDFVDTASTTADAQNIMQSAIVTMDSITATSDDMYAASYKQEHAAILKLQSVAAETNTQKKNESAQHISVAFDPIILYIDQRVSALGNIINDPVSTTTDLLLDNNSGMYSPPDIIKFSSGAEWRININFVNQPSLIVMFRNDNNQSTGNLRFGLMPNDIVMLQYTNTVTSFKSTSSTSVMGILDNQSFYGSINADIKQQLELL